MKTLTQMSRWNLAICLGLMTALMMGCGDGKKDEDDKKEAKAKDLKALLVGQWELDMAATAADSNAKDEASKPMLKMMREEKKDDDEKMVLEFNADGSTSMSMTGQEPDSGKYEVEDKGDHLIVKITEAKKAPPGETIIRFADDDTFTFEAPEDDMMPFKKMFFKRVK